MNLRVKITNVHRSISTKADELSMSGYDGNVSQLLRLSTFINQYLHCKSPVHLKLFKKSWFCGISVFCSTQLISSLWTFDLTFIPAKVEHTGVSVRSQILLGCAHELRSANLTWNSTGTSHNRGAVQGQCSSDTPNSAPLKTKCRHCA